MRNLFFIICVCVATTSIAQPVRVHLMGGFANYNGDLQQKRFTLQQAEGAAGVGATFNLTDHLSGRGDFFFAHVGADDKRNTKPELVARNLKFRSRIFEISLLGEYDFFNLNEHKLSPYVFLGIGLFHFSPFTYDAVGQKVYLSGLSTEGEGILPWKKDYKRTSPIIPLGAGLKYALSDDIHVGAEVGLRILRTDYLDDVSSTYVDQNLLIAARGQQAVDYAFRGDELKTNPTTYPAAGALRGNNKVNDFYYFGLLRIDFRLNWFDNGGNSRGRKSLNCPKI